MRKHIVRKSSNEEENIGREEVEAQPEQVGRQSRQEEPYVGNGHVSAVQAEISDGQEVPALVGWGSTFIIRLWQQQSLPSVKQFWQVRKGTIHANTVHYRHLELLPATLKPAGSEASVSTCVALIP